jgi:hypothetical protein
VVDKTKDITINKKTPLFIYCNILGVLKEFPGLKTINEILPIIYQNLYIKQYQSFFMGQLPFLTRPLRFILGPMAANLGNITQMKKLKKFINNPF